MTKKRKLILILLPLAILFVSATVLYWQRNAILEPFVQKKIARFEQGKPIKISYDNFHLSGLSKVEINGLAVCSNSDTLVHVHEIGAKISLWKMLFKKEIELKDLYVNGFALSLKNDDGKRIYDFLFRRKREGKQEATAGITSGYTQKATKALALFFRFVPENILITDMNVSLQQPDFTFNLTVPELKIVDHRFFSQVKITEKGEKQDFVLEGAFWRKDKKLACKVYPQETALAQIPYLQHKLHTRIAFDTLQFQFLPTIAKKELLQLSGIVSFDQLIVENERLSTEEISLQNSKVDYVLNIHPDRFELDSATIIRLDKLDFHPYVQLKLKPAVDLTVSIREDNFPADHLFSSLPKGLFRNLEGIKTSGNLSYRFFFAVNMAEVDSLKFHSSMSRDNFKIEQFGKTDFTKSREPFSYSAYEKGEVVKTFEVGEDFTDFRKLEEISPYLRAAVLYAEDGSFFGHAGFNEEALQASLVLNIKERRFARGGSTVSMQLVKNLYLSRDKTITRKLEEALIVWLIENNRLVSKNRMYEIYLNIIEWGPGIYGANDAARFYFNKDAADLTPEEAIFMASIVSRPKKFMWSFDKNRELKPYLAGFYEILGKRMLMHEYITQEQFESLTPKVHITGAASAYLAEVEDAEMEEDESDLDD